MFHFLKGKNKENVLYAPCKGKVVPLSKDKYNWEEHKDHFILAEGDGEVDFGEGKKNIYALDGTEILIHIGLDTVTLKGAPFTAHVAAGDQVKKGDLLMDVDLDKITGAGLNTVTPVLICNTDDYEKISLKKEGEVSLDEAVLSIS